MILAYLLLLTGLTISSVAIYYSVVGLTAIFSAAAVPIMIMGVSLEVAKLVCATWIKQYWTQVPRLMKTYMCIAITVLMLITSMGIFGFLSKAHNDQNLVSGDIGAKIAVYDEKIRTSKDNIDANRKALKQMDEAVDQIMARSSSEAGANQAVGIRRSQQKERTRLQSEIQAEQKTIASLSEEAAPVRAEVRKVEAEVGPIKYIAAFLYGTAPDAGMLEQAVTWIIILIVIVFDPLAVIMLLASQMTFAWNRKPEEETVEDPATVVWTEEIKEPVKPVKDDEYDNAFRYNSKDNTWSNLDNLEPVFDREEIPDFTDYSEGALISTADPEPEEELPVVEKKPRWSGFSFPMFSHILQPKSEVEEPVIFAGTPEVVDTDPVPQTNPMAMDERPGDYVEPPVVKEPPRPANPEAAPARGRGVMNIHLELEADNSSNLGKAANSSFGTEYPKNPERGDSFVRVDYLPNRLFKFNGDRWIEVDKTQTDLYAYDELYIKHLISEIEAGRYDTDVLTELESNQIEEYLKK